MIERKPPSRPVLWNYATKSYRDNFVDPTAFLANLTVYAPTHRAYRDTVLGALHVANHVCLVGALVGTWLSLAAEPDSVSDVPRALSLFAFEAAMFLFTMLLQYRKSSRLSSSMLLSHVRQAAVLIATVVVLSPIYAELTASISADSTIALVIVLMIVHLYLYDYRDQSIVSKRSPRPRTYTASLICGMCASVLASTTMHGILDVIAVTLMALELYIGSPYLLHGLYGLLGKVQTSVLVTGCVLAGAGLPLLLQVWLSALLFVIVVLCPMWMVRIGHYRAHISGPWDEAAPSFDD
jgi:phosphatidylinositol glycan class C protein